MKKIIVTILFILLATLRANTINIDEKSNNLDILSHSEIYIDEINNLTKDEVEQQVFEENNKSVLGFGFVANYAVWVKFTLHNNSDKVISKVIEYDNPETEDIEFYDGNSVIVEGMFHHNAKRVTINPTFHITLQADESRTYFIKAHCKMSTLIVKLKLWEEEKFLADNFKKQTIIFIFFTVIATLLLYNFMLFVFTRDEAYFFYILYLTAIIFFEGLYLGVAQLYLLSNELSIIITKATFTYISLLVLPIILFTREFLNTYRYPKIDWLLTSYIYVAPVISLMSYDNWYVNLNVIIIFIPLGFMLVAAGLYALYDGQKQAKFYIFGWTFVIISLVLSILKSLGGFDASIYFIYINEVAFSFEALLFSIALAHRIKLLDEEKSLADKEIIALQKKEQIKLQHIVDEKIETLEIALGEKDTLFKELNHRVKNNIQMVLSLVKLQISKTDSKQTQTELEVTKNRIHSILYLYERLTLNTSNEQLSTKEYLRDIVQSLNHKDNVHVIYNIQYELCLDKLVYVGLIVNELVTNSFKYAFIVSGEIRITLYKTKGIVHLDIRDNGKGFIKENKISLGLEIVNTLVTKQLLGDINISSENGTRILIQWSEDE